MDFFVTSEGSGKGADQGGLAGADARCQKLAAAAGAGSKTWRAVTIPALRRDFFAASDQNTGDRVKSRING